MKRSGFVWVCVLVLMGCDRSPYPGYRTVANEVYMRLIALGDGERTAADEDSVRIRFRVAALGEEPGSLLSTERTFSVEALRTGALVPVFRDLHEGDSMSVITTSAQFPWSTIAPAGTTAPKTAKLVQLELLLLEIRTPAMWKAEQERMRRNDPMGFERRIMERYIANSGQEWTRWGTSALHYRISGEAADTARVMKGEVVSISYVGRRLEDGQVFDDTERNGGSLSFRFGDKDQVVRGLEVAVSLLRPGQKGTFLLPSELAFGAKGIEVIIEPWTAVEYTVELGPMERAMP